MTILRMFARMPCMLRYRHVKLVPCHFRKVLQPGRYVGTATKFNLDTQNVLSSGLTPIMDFENVYLHDLIWENVDRWWDNTALVRDAMQNPT